jgi:hypothetical protein
VIHAIFLTAPPTGADTLYLKDGQVVEGEITYETEAVVRLREDFGEVGFIEVDYDPLKIERIYRTPPGPDTGPADFVQAKGLTKAEAGAIYKAVEALYQRELSGQEIWPRVAEQFGLTEAEVQEAYSRILFQRRYTDENDAVRLKVYEALRPFSDIAVLGEIIFVRKDSVSLKYLDRSGAADAYDITQRVNRLGPKLAEAIFILAPEINRVRFEVHRRVPNRKPEERESTERVAKVTFSRPAASPDAQKP